MAEPFLHDAPEVKFLSGGEKRDHAHIPQVILPPIIRDVAVLSGSSLGLWAHDFSGKVSWSYQG
ncbi:MAG: hypothetical protein ACK5PF_05495 [bacterium]|jgi:hypothetical protein